jgi:8-amino-7-oxononanoate synthase
MGQEYYQNQLDVLKQQHNYRHMLVMDASMQRIGCVDGEDKLIFCSNDYLGLANHPEIISAIKRGLDRWGFGSGGSRLICGNQQPHEHLQERLARRLGKEAALVLPSGWCTNTALLSTLGQKDDLIAVDKLCHASIIDGAMMSPATMRRWEHRQSDKLKHLLDSKNYKKAFIVTDSLFSMDGDRAHLAELVELKQKYDAMLIVDEAHAFGCIGPDGAGCAAEAGVLDKVDIITGTLSKALGGAGGFIVCDEVISDYLVNTMRGFIFTTAMPAINCLAAEAALDIVEKQPQRRRRLNDNGNYLRQRCAEMQLDMATSDSYIVPIILGSAETTMAAAEQLRRKGFMVSAVRPPTVRPGGSRLRISLTSEHSKADIDGLSQALGEVLCD